ncbi:Mrpl36 protein [Candida orthopsilosis Co 90-125]|uniref:Mrpl36 protein n=1 Tax=Candida orthopsilosis (strain 90-125) TaxID=1136231 RepID=H8X864_CANO9|nr:Mrpl36 protein [Candida orthopsilosis Co 90-125]CCG24163.1 Mrpl36 protein [Candida orthopsilosis Co 90-125]
MLSRIIPNKSILSSMVCQQIRNKQTISMVGEVNLSSRRVMRKIKLGKARPAIMYQFDTLVELSDGSVIKRRSQAPKDEIRMINDQRNSLKWNPHRADLDTSDLTATGKIGKFRSKYAGFSGEEETQDKKETKGKDAEKELSLEEEETLKAKEKELSKARDQELFDLMGENAEEIVGGGKLYDKKADKKRFK